MALSHCHSLSGHTHHGHFSSPSTMCYASSGPLPGLGSWFLLPHPGYEGLPFPQLSTPLVGTGSRLSPRSGALPPAVLTGRQPRDSRGSGMGLLWCWDPAPCSAQSKAAGPLISLGCRAGSAPLLPRGHQPPESRFLHTRGMLWSQRRVSSGRRPGVGNADDFCCCLKALSRSFSVRGTRYDMGCLPRGCTVP